MEHAVTPKLLDYFHARGKRFGLPIAGNFELTARCDFNCKMCHVHLTEAEQRRRGRELAAQEWIALGEAAKRAGTVFLLLTGGEPFLRPDVRACLPDHGAWLRRRMGADAQGHRRHPSAGCLRLLLPEFPVPRLRGNVLYGETGRFDGKPDYLCRLNRSYLKHTLALWQSEYGGAHTAVQ